MSQPERRTLTIGSRTGERITRPTTAAQASIPSRCTNSASDIARSLAAAMNLDDMQARSAEAFARKLLGT